MLMIESQLTFLSDDSVLQEGFTWAKAQALAYAFTGDPVGDWYEAALPSRAAFCMRDVSHQATGAHLLGLAGFTRNMLHRFAENTSARRGWCSFWEIDKFNRPCPVDYRDDDYFWYNFPANFDVLDCCLRQYLWTADRTYLEDPAFRFFYTKSVNEYVQHWDWDRDGLMEHDPSYGCRGIATYNEEVPDPLVGGDLVAAQAAGYRAFADLLDLEGREMEATSYRDQAAALKRLYNEEWWDALGKRFYGFMNQDRSFATDDQGLGNIFTLYFDLADGEERVSRTLDTMIKIEPTLNNVESRSYIPEILYRYGRNQAAYAVLKSLLDPHLPRREYPELAYALIGALGTGLMGLKVDAREHLVSTLPHLTSETDQAEMRGVPVLGTHLDLCHMGCTETTLTNQGWQPFYWQAAFPGQVEMLVVNGQPWRAQQATRWDGQRESYVLMRVGGGEKHTVCKSG
jgi:hypothetical protein